MSTVLTHLRIGSCTHLTNVVFENSLRSLAAPHHYPPLLLHNWTDCWAQQCPAMPAIRRSRGTAQALDGTQLTTGYHLWTSGILPRRHSTVKNATAHTTSFQKERKIKGTSLPKPRERFYSIKEAQSYSHWASRVSTVALCTMHGPSQQLPSRWCVLTWYYTISKHGYLPYCAHQGLQKNFYIVLKISRSGEMAQRLRHWTQEHENWSSDPQHHIHTARLWYLACNLRSMKAETEDPCPSQAS